MEQFLVEQLNQYDDYDTERNDQEEYNTEQPEESVEDHQRDIKIMNDLEDELGYGRSLVQNSPRV